MKKKGNNKVIIWVVLLAVIGGAVYYFFFYKKKDATTTTSGAVTGNTTDTTKQITAGGELPPSNVEIPQNIGGTSVGATTGQQYPIAGVPPGGWGALINPTQITSLIPAIKLTQYNQGGNTDSRTDTGSGSSYLTPAVNNGRVVVQGMQDRTTRKSQYM